jgi:type II secretory pathway pseudopilin PulG
MTILEMMVVIAIIGGAIVLVRSGFRLVTKADLVENSNELAAIMRRASQLAIERGEMHRIVIDLDAHQYLLEVCQGQTALVRNEALRNDTDEQKRALERGKQRMQDLPTDALAAGDADEAVKKATAVAGHHIADRQCAPATEGMTGDSTGGGWQRKLKSGKGIKFKEVWVQHRDDSATKGQVAIYFFPVGSAEKAVIEITDGSETFSVLVHGLTGRVDLRDGALKDVDEHMLRNAMGDKDAAREEPK